jgi:hypothetical protein
MLELLVAALVLFGVAAWTGDGWISALAVVLSFAHMQVADRLAEAEERRPSRDVECHRKLRWYLVAKELAWVAAFASAGLWPALVGCGLFLGYPVWRRFYRRWRPV